VRRRRRRRKKKKKKKKMMMMMMMMICTMSEYEYAVIFSYIFRPKRLSSG